MIDRIGEWFLILPILQCPEQFSLLRKHNSRGCPEQHHPWPDPEPDQQGPGRGRHLPADTAGRQPGHRQGHERPQHERVDEESDLLGWSSHHSHALTEGVQLTDENERQEGLYQS